MTDPDRPWDVPAEPSKTKRPWGCIVPIVSVLVIGVSCGVVGAQGAGDDGVSDYSVQKQCQRWVDEKLKAPDTAKYSQQLVVANGENSWTVTGAVDAENSFGASIRGSWQCAIRLEGDTWKGRATLD